MEEMLALSSSLNAARMDSQVGVLVAKKALDAQEQQGAAMIELLQAAAETGRQDGSGGLDLYA